MRVLGVICVLLACAAAGRYAARRLKDDAEAQSCLIALTEDAAALIRCLQPELPDMLLELAEKPIYRRFTFLRTAGEGMCPGTPPADVWTAAVEADTAVPREARPILVRLGTTLGTTDVTGQLAVLSLIRTELAQTAAAAKERSRTQGQLFSRLGLLGGAMVAVLLL
ncbi:MAG: stage III sporulation protein AB [Oscillospiraceae bacterium]|nr:stage III sporulation protein AB [Oscillospiraceae bacterium]